MKKGLITKLLSFAEELAGDWNKKHSSRRSDSDTATDSTKMNSSRENIPRDQKNDFPEEASRQQSLRSSQNPSEYSGTDREKGNWNMSQRNF